VLCLVAGSALGLACKRDCRSLDDCGPEHCAVLSALHVGQEQPQPVACVAKAKDNAPGVVTYARDGAGGCWIFPTTLVAEGYVADDSCRP
jgi:hypothetical protein